MSAGAEATVFARGRILDPHSGTDEEGDVRVVGQEVVGVGPSGTLAQPGDRVIDCDGAWVVPGFVDLHVHLREPGLAHKEDIESGARAAVFGGFTTIVAMPNTFPVIDSVEVAAAVARRAEEVNLARVLVTGAITVGQRGERLTDMLALKGAGCVAFTDDGRPVPTALLMRRALEYARACDTLIISHAEDLSLSEGGAMHEGAHSCQMGLGGIPRAAEEVCIARDLLLCALTGARLHIAHVSTEGGVAMIREAKARGLRVSCEATPHHFSLTAARVLGPSHGVRDWQPLPSAVPHAAENAPGRDADGTSEPVSFDISAFDTSAKMNPPLRTEADRAAIVAGLADGTIDCIATDHAPHAPWEKDVPFAEAPFGIVGLETALPLTLELVRRQELTPLRAIELLTLGASRVLADPRLGRLAASATADLTVIDPEREWVANRFRSRSNNSPWLGMKLKGCARFTMVRGQLHTNDINGSAEGAK